jgi:hypothetical protein
MVNGRPSIFPFPAGRSKAEGVTTARAQEIRTGLAWLHAADPVLAREIELIQPNGGWRHRVSAPAPGRPVRL